LSHFAGYVNGGAVTVITFFEVAPQISTSTQAEQENPAGWREDLWRLQHG
jgi:hypothetical protein